MRTLLLLFALGGCRVPAARVSLEGMPDGAVTPATAADLAEHDAALTSSHDLADPTASDLRGPADLAIAPAPDLSAPPDLAPAYSIGSPCTLNVQCADTLRQTCDITGDSYLRCCVYEGDPCTSNSDCCQRTGVGNGFCMSGVCGRSNPGGN